MIKKPFKILAILVFVVSIVYCATLEIDYMEYTTDALANEAYSTTTKILLHGDSSGTGVTFIDEMGATITAYGDTRTSLTQKKFGNASLKFDGSGDYLTLPSKTDYNFGTGDFTVDFWLMFTTVNTQNTIIDRGAAPQIFYYVTTGKIYFYTSGGTVVSVAWTPTTGVWYHIAMVRLSGVVTGYINGAVVVSGSLPENISNSSVFNVGGSAGGYFTGYIDELHATKTAQWSADFSASLPTAAYGDLKVWTDGTFKTQGSYSLKFVSETTSLNYKIVKTFAVNHNLTSVNNLIFDVMASRTGSNFTFGLHDVGGTTTELTPNITTAGNVWQRVNWSLAGVTDANKDAIDLLKITMINADFPDTVRVDNFKIGQCENTIGTY